MKDGAVLFSIFDGQKILLSGQWWCVAISAIGAAFSGCSSVVRSSGYHGDGRDSGSFGGERHLGEEEQCAMK